MAVVAGDRVAGSRFRVVPATIAVPSLGLDVRVTVIGLLIGMLVIAGMVAESSPVTTAGAGVALAAAVFYPPVGLVALSFLAPLRMPLVIPPPGLNSVLVAAIILGCILRLPSERLLPPSSRRALRIGAPVVIAGGFLLYATIQQLPEMATGYASDAAHDIGYLFYQLATGFGAIIAAGMVIRGRSPYPYLVALLVATLFAGVLAIITADEVPFARLENLIPPTDGDGRATGPFGNPNAFGQLIAYGMTLALGLIVIASRWRYRVPLALVSAVLGYALFISLSRGALAALAAGVIVIAFFRSRRTGIATILIAAVLAAIIYPAFVSWRLTNLEGAADRAAYQQLADSDGGRLEAVLAAPALFALSPVFGIGFGQYKFMTAQVTENRLSIVAHNWYGTVFAEQGLLGVALWGLLLLSVVVALRRRPPPQQQTGAAVLASIVAGSFFLQPPTQFQLAALPVIVITAALVGVWKRGDADIEVGPPVPTPPRRLPFAQRRGKRQAGAAVRTTA
jgi:O-antigen ligase